jgi:RNA polymerase sigma-70 factor, ECF subfamily
MKPHRYPERRVDETFAITDDVALVRAVATGSQDALAALYDRHAGAVHSAASRLTADRQIAEEVVQETFLALWNRAELFDPGTGSLAAWLHTIARNRTVDRLRAGARRPRLVSAALTGGPDEPEAVALDRLAVTGTVIGGADRGNGPEDEVVQTELRATLRAALVTMPDVERTVIVLAYTDGLTQSEIAERLGWPLGTVKTRTRRALLHMRALLAEHHDPGLRPVPIPVEMGES